MQRFSQKYTIVQFFEDVPAGTEFVSSNWPLHSTLVDTFAIDWSEGEICAQLAIFLSDIRSVQSVAKHDVLLGNDQVLVTALEKTADLQTLHTRLVTLLEKGGLRLNDVQFAREGFLPHSTIQSHARLYKDDEVSFCALSLIDMFPGRDPYKRKVIATFPLKH